MSNNTVSVIILCKEANDRFVECVNSAKSLANEMLKKRWKPSFSLKYMGDIFGQILDDISKSDTIPYNIVKNDDVTIQHEATVSKVSEEQLFYLMSRGLTEEQATEMIVMGFIEPFAKELPMEYAVELNQLLKLEMNGSIG